MLVACTGDSPPTAIDGDSPAARAIDPSNWPLQQSVFERSASEEAAIRELLDRMTVEEKVGQIIQADIASVTPDDVREFNLGSVLNGGGSAPGGDNRTSADQWLELADEFWYASTDRADGGVGVPLIWGTDAVHGHNNIVGATLFPHNIGLGMANDPELMYDIGRVTAVEMLVTGLDWTFAPTIAVARDDRWGRTYESYSEDPAIVAAYAPRIVEGIQGAIGSAEFLSDDRMLATVKHFVGDGGTQGGVDQGDTIVSESELRDVHAHAYLAAIRAGVQSVMASFSGYRGVKMHGHRALLNDVLIDRFGFDGFVVGDWNGHGQVAGCSNTQCAAAVNAGLDMFMAPDSWKVLYASTLEQVRDGSISRARLDEAVARILRVKFRAGVMEAGPPSSRRYAGEYWRLGSAEHRAVARDAVRKSLVLLKNSNNVLPISPESTVSVVGGGANDIGKQSGGWTLSWQGTGNRNEHFPNGTSIYGGFVELMGTENVRLGESCAQAAADVAVVVFGEDPYAEFQGDRTHVDYASDDGLLLLEECRALGVPTVAVFLSGRPLWVNPELNAADAFVAAWLPGTEGAGVADVLVASDDGTPRYDFEGRLSFSWPRDATQTTVNVGDDNYDPLFAYGYGLDYSDDGELARLPEEDGLDGKTGGFAGNLLEYGDPAGAWAVELRDAMGSTRITDGRGQSAAGQLILEPADYEAQEDSTVLTWSGASTFALTGNPADFTREANGDMAVEFEYRVIDIGDADIGIAMLDDRAGGNFLDISDALDARAGKGWSQSLVKLACFADQGADMGSVSQPLVIAATGPVTLQIRSARIVGNPGNAGCAF